MWYLNSNSSCWAILGEIFESEFEGFFLEKFIGMAKSGVAFGNLAKIERNKIFWVWHAYVWTNSKEMVPSFSKFFTAPCLRRMSSLAIINTVLGNTYGSLWITCTKTGTDVPHNGTSPSRLLVHSASCSASSDAINSDSIVDLAMQDCFADFQDIAPTPSKNT